MANIQAGTYTVQQILEVAGLDFNREAAADYLNGQPDYRRVRVGGLGFDSLEECIVVPVTTDELVVALDGKTHTTLKVTLSSEQQEERDYSFRTAADTDGPAKRTVQEPAPLEGVKPE
jgi:hypothetical protein